MPFIDPFAKALHFEPLPEDAARIGELYARTGLKGAALIRYAFAALLQQLRRADGAPVDGDPGGVNPMGRAHP